ncbi:hypothetical protein Tco_0637218 [Tanacetum coccineum]
MLSSLSLKFRQPPATDRRPSPRRRRKTFPASFSGRASKTSLSPDLFNPHHYAPPRASPSPPPTHRHLAATSTPPTTAAAALIIIIIIISSPPPPHCHTTTPPLLPPHRTPPSPSHHHLHLPATTFPSSPPQPRTTKGAFGLDLHH